MSHNKNRFNAQNILGIIPSVDLYRTPNYNVLTTVSRHNRKVVSKKKIYNIYSVETPYTYIMYFVDDSENAAYVSLNKNSAKILDTNSPVTVINNFVELWEYKRGIKS